MPSSRPYSRSFRVLEGRRGLDLCGWREEWSGLRLLRRRCRGIFAMAARAYSRHSDSSHTRVFPPPRAATTDDITGIASCRLKGFFIDVDHGRLCESLLLMPTHLLRGAFPHRFVPTFAVLERRMRVLVHVHLGDGSRLRIGCVLVAYCLHARIWFTYLGDACAYWLRIGSRGRPGERAVPGHWSGWDWLSLYRDGGLGLCTPLGVGACHFVSDPISFPLGPSMLIAFDAFSTFAHSMVFRAGWGGPFFRPC